MRRKLLAVLGLILFLAGIGIGGYLIIGAIRALVLDENIFKLPVPKCSNISWKASLPNRLMSENETQALTVSIFNRDTKDCEEDVSLDAPGFNMNRPERTFIVPAMRTIPIAWILMPQKLGTFALDVELTEPLEGKILGITVTNVFGLNPWQTQLLAYIGTILGPMLTAAWWYERWQERKERKRAHTQPTSAPPITQIPQGPIGKHLADMRQKNKPEVSPSTSAREQTRQILFASQLKLGTVYGLVLGGLSVLILFILQVSLQALYLQMRLNTGAILYFLGLGILIGLGTLSILAGLLPSKTNGSLLSSGIAGGILGLSSFLTVVIYSLAQLGTVSYVWLIVAVFGVPPFIVSVLFGLLGRYLYKRSRIS